MTGELPPIDAASLRFESSLEVVPDLMVWFERFNRAPVSNELWLQALTALTEVFSNAVIHAHHALTPPPAVEIAVAIGPAEFRIAVTDHGPAYDFAGALAAIEQVVDAPAFDPLERDAHWGQILLLRLRNDHGWTLAYGPDPAGGNRLELRHPLPAAPRWDGRGGAGAQ